MSLSGVKMPKFIGNIKHFNQEDLRFATPVIVADYRAERLKCNKIIDLCSGIGIQAGAFAKTCGQVLGIEIDERKVKFSKENFKEMNNLQFVQGDVLDKKIIQKIQDFKPDIIFCDPERLAEEKERTLYSIKPDLKKLIEIYSKLCKNICIEMPPRINIEKLKDFICEKEYLSLNNKLNRLDIYFGSLKKSEVSVVDVESKARIEKSDKTIKIKSIKSPLKYIFEISEAVIKAGLTSELAEKIGSFILINNNKILLTSNNSKNNFYHNLCKNYEVMGICNNLNEVIRILKQKQFNKVVLKYSIEPKDYWKERNYIENQLKGIGNHEANLFRINNQFVIGEEI
jgi:16S rRNA G966 N2-methylase RsmD